MNQLANTPPPLRVGVLGASGLLGMQFVALLSKHRLVAELLPFSISKARQYVSSISPAFQHLNELQFASPDVEVLNACDWIFCAMPHGKSFPFVRQICEETTRFIDVSSDFRVQDADLYQKIHGVDHPLPEWLPRFERVIPEVNGNARRDGRLLSLPGCNSTALILALYPLLAEKWVKTRTPIIVDAKVGSSGAGNVAGTAPLHIQRANGVRVHKVMTEHRHSSEVAAFLDATLGVKVTVYLNVHSVDLVRGVLCSIYVETNRQVTKRDLFSLYRSFYRDSPWIRLVCRGSGYDRFPNPKHVANTNFCDIGFTTDPGNSRIVLFAAIDNLIRGGAGQAVQMFNCCNAIDEMESLPTFPVYP